MFVYIFLQGIKKTTLIFAHINKMYNFATTYSNTLFL